MTSEQREEQWDKFEESEAVHRRQSYKRAAVLATVFIIAAASLDWVVFREFFGSFFIGRLVTGALLLLVLFGLTITKNRTLFRILGHCVALLPMLVIDWMIYHTGGGSSPYYGGLCTVLVGATLILRWPTADSIVNALICVGGYLYISLILHPNNHPGDVFTHTYFMFVTAVFACVGTYFYNDIRFREFLLVQEVEAAREEVELTNQQLRAIDETKSRFFANLSHELRTPLTLILGPAENLRGMLEAKKDPICDEYLDTIEENGYRLLRLINDILDLVKLDSGESPPRPESVDVKTFIEGMVSNMRPIASMKEVSISSRCDVSDLPIAWLDRDRLEKIILNLSVNAVKFTSSGGSIILSAEAKRGKLTFAVADTGEGMSEEDVENVFVRFWQADMSAKRKHRGAGIGLSLVKSLTESMDGAVKVSSKLGEGTTFGIEFPAIEPPLEAPSEDVSQVAEDVLERFNTQARSRTDRASAERSLEPENIQRETQSIVNSDGAEAIVGRKRVLVADDEQAMRHFITRQLSDYDLVEARDGDQAWSLAKEHKPDLVILDLMMPGLDGIEVTRKIRSHEKLSRVPVILITAQASEAPRLEALEAGVNDFISKPFSTVELNVRAKNLLSSAEFEVKLADNHQQLESAFGQLKEQESLLVQTEKLSSLGRMSAGIVHEVNNPLNYTKTALHALETFKSVLPDDEREDYLDVLGDAREGVQRVIGIVSDLRSFTRGDSAHMDEILLVDVIESARRLTSSGMSGMKFTSDVDDQIRIEGNEGQLCQLLVNLFQNAIRAIETKQNLEQGDIIVSANFHDNGTLVLKVRDNGCGMTEEVKQQIFDPFFTKNDVGEGMGLGLSISHRIIKQHEATVSVESEVGEFTEFTILFPAKG
ncbi:MAG: ATP-binding protein [Akkermansiaceae bacterium]